MGELTRVASSKDIASGQAVAVEAQGHREEFVEFMDSK